MGTQAAPAPVSKGNTWKSIFLKAAGFGAGMSVVLLLVLGGFIWYESRPTPPKPWNTSAIKATFYDVSTTDGDKLNFNYILENTTDLDYTLEKFSNVRVAGVTKDQHDVVTDGQFELHFPVFIPSKHKASVSLTLNTYTYKPTHEYDADSDEKRDAYYLDVATHVDTRLRNLNGFTLFDETNRYEINLPNGWHSYVEKKTKKTDVKATSTEAAKKD